MRAIEATPSFSRHRWWSLGVAALATLIVTADAGQLSIAFPVIIAEFHADLSLASWIALVYALVTASLYLPCGKLSDLVGTGRLFSAGFLIHAASSLAAGFSQNGGQLIIFRTFQAAGSAFIMANNFAVVTALFPPEERGRAMGISGGTVAALGYTLGPVFGGLLTHALGWRSNFYVTATLGVVGFVAARLLLSQARPTRATDKTEPFDLAGAIAFALSICLLLHALTTAQKGIWRSSVIGFEFVGGLLSLGVFIGLESRARFPLLNLKLFQIPAFTLGNVTRAISFITISVNILLMPFFLQLAMGMDPLRAGLLIVPTPLALALLSPVAGWLSEKMIPERLCSLGLAIKGIAFVVLSLLSVGAAWFQVVFGLTLLGVGMAFFQTPNNNLLMSSVPRDCLGVGSAFLSIVRSLGSAIGAALATTIVSAYLLQLTGQTSLQNLQPNGVTANEPALLAAFLTGFRYAYLTAAIISFAGAALSVVRVSGKRC